MDNSFCNVPAIERDFASLSLLFVHDFSDNAHFGEAGYDSAFRGTG
jgi:hypothetical protein